MATREPQPWLWWALLLLAAALYPLGLGSAYAPTNGDEMVYLHIARLTADSGHWLPLVSDLGAMRNTKPPLLFWQAMLAGQWGDAWSLFAVRLPAVAYTLLTAAGVAVIAHRLGGRMRTALLAAIVYLAFFSSFRYGRVYLTSAAETFWLGLPMFWLLLQTTQEKRRTLGWQAYSLFGLALGLGCAYKSFALLAPAAATLWLSAVLTQDTQAPWDWQPVRRVTTGLAFSSALALGIFALWFVLDPDPAAVWREFVVGENAGKLGGGAGSQGGYWHNALQGGESIWVHLLAYAENAGLLGFVVLGLAWALLRQGPALAWAYPPRPVATGRSALRPSGQASPWAPRWLASWPPAWTVLLLWLLVWLLVFAIPNQRSARYVIPAMPALAIVLALAWEHIGRAWFAASLLLAAPALVLLVRIAWVLHGTDIGTPALLVAALVVGAVGLGAVVLGLLRPAATRAAALLACLSVYACFGAMVAPLDRDAAHYRAAIAQPLAGASVAVPNGFNAQYERFHFLLPHSTLAPYDTEGRNTGTLYPDLPAAERLDRLLQEFDAVVWVQPNLAQAAPSCAPGCKVLAQRWHVKSRHQSGEITWANLWYPQEWLFRREWLLVRAPTATP